MDQDFPDRIQIFGRSGLRKKSLIRTRKKTRNRNTASNGTQLSLNRVRLLQRLPICNLPWDYFLHPHSPSSSSPIVYLLERAIFSPTSVQTGVVSPILARSAFTAITRPPAQGFRGLGLWRVLHNSVSEPLKFLCGSGSGIPKMSIRIQGGKLY